MHPILRRTASATVERFKYCKHIYGRGWRWIVPVLIGVPYAGMNLYDFIRGEAFPDLPAIGKSIPSWGWIAWGIVFAIALIIITIEASYRYTQDEKKKLEIIRVKS